LKARSANGARVHRVDRDARVAEPSRQLLRKQGRGKLRLSVKSERLVEEMPIQIVEHNPFFGRLFDARATGNDDDSARTGWHQVEQSIDQQKMADVIDQKLQFDPVSRFERFRFALPPLWRRCAVSAGPWTPYPSLTRSHLSEDARNAIRGRTAVSGQSHRPFFCWSIDCSTWCHPVRAESSSFPVARASNKRPKKGLCSTIWMGHLFYKPFTFYGQSKLATALFAKELSRRLSDSGIAVNSVHPGAVGERAFNVASAFHSISSCQWRGLFMKSIAQGRGDPGLLGSKPLVNAVTGEYWADCKVARGSKYLEDPQMAHRVWTVFRRDVASHIGPA